MAQGRHHFDQSLPMPPTRLSETEIEHLIEELRLKTKWTGPSYQILERHGSHFADVLSQRLEVAFPQWAYHGLVAS